MEVFRAAILLHSTCGYYITPDCPVSVPPPNILEKSMPLLVLLFTGYCDVPRFLLHFKISFSVQV